jgi:hypothetical protein
LFIFSTKFSLAFLPTVILSAAHFAQLSKTSAARPTGFNTASHQFGRNHCHLVLSEASAILHFIPH